MVTVQFIIIVAMAACLDLGLAVQGIWAKALARFGTCADALSWAFLVEAREVFTSNFVRGES